MGHGCLYDSYTRSCIIALIHDDHQQKRYETKYIWLINGFSVHTIIIIIYFAETTLTGDRVSYVGGRASYDCFGGGVIVDVQWLVNGTRVEDLNLGDDVVVEFSLAREEGDLLFRNIPAEYNETTIQCRANYSSETSSTSGTVTLLLQG